MPRRRRSPGSKREYNATVSLLRARRPGTEDQSEGRLAEAEALGLALARIELGFVVRAEALALRRADDECIVNDAGDLGAGIGVDPCPQVVEHARGHADAPVLDRVAVGVDASADVHAVDHERDGATALATVGVG